MAAMQAWKDSLVSDEAKDSPGFTAQALKSLAGSSRDAARSTVHDWVHQCHPEAGQGLDGVDADLPSSPVSAW
jgi:hypothetical protein